MERVAFTAAPLLAGFAVTFMGFVLTSNVSMHWPNLTLAMLTTAAMLLIFTIQLAFNARLHYLPYQEFRAQLELLDGSPQEVRVKIAARDRYIDKLATYRRLIRWAGVLYNAGIVTLLLAIATALVPPGTTGNIDTGRVVAITVATLAAILEIVWSLSNELAARYPRG
jgi:hypothetical protein